MSDRNETNPKLELRLNLSPPRVVDRRLESPNLSAIISPPSPPSSCASTDVKQEREDDNNNLGYSNSPEVVPLVLVGCHHCLMYIMVAKDNLMCPKCKSTALIEFLHDNNNNPIIRKKED
uniref:GIR1-like zinc ribbon domain-containing protein n=1 Tax=Cajanus cajan TaxID=3821 RepID=A0A151QUB0_CAJCA|nr:hypothetical protein KK1_045191 [Cajanus cajan]KYP73854.1 hypothetical protein KK1_006511 [Cajanus cajan]